MHYDVIKYRRLGQQTIGYMQIMRWHKIDTTLKM